MRMIPSRLAFVLLLLVGGCAAPEPPFASLAATIPPPAPGQARIFFYRWLEPYETLTPTTAYLNDAAVGVTETGAVLYRDVAPGRYLVAVDSEGVYTNQFKTVILRPGDIAYIRVESLRSWSNCRTRTTGCWDTFVVNVINPAVALDEMRDLRLIHG